MVASLSFAVLGTAQPQLVLTHTILGPLIPKVPLVAQKYPEMKGWRENQSLGQVFPVLTYFLLVKLPLTLCHTVSQGWQRHLS